MRESSTLLHRLYLWFLDAPATPAQYYKDESQNWQPVTVKTYWLNVVRIAQALRAAGMQKGDRVLIYAMNSPEWVQWELGILLAGGMSVGIHSNTSQIDVEKIIDLVNPYLAIVESELYQTKIAKEKTSSAQVLTFKESLLWIESKVSSDEVLLAAQGLELLKMVNPEEPQIIIYTSGTTGEPKGVLLGIRQLSFVAECLSREWNLSFANGTLFSFLPLSHVAEKLQSVAVAITQRYPVWFNSKYERFIQEMKEVRPSLFLAVPRVWERIQEQVESHKPRLLQRLMEFEKIGSIAEKIYLSQVKEQLGLDRLTLAVSGAVKLPPAVAEWFQNLGIEIQEIYGMSESAGLIALTKAERTNFVDVGRAPLGIEVKLSPDGEIWVRGDNVFFGYYQDEEETKKVLLEDGWLKTGDLGEWNVATKELNIIGRNREIIKLSNGRMVAPLPIENALKEIQEISNVCLVGEGRASLLALITLKEDILMEYKFTPGAIEGLSVEDVELKERMREKIKSLYDQKKIHERINRFVILSREFSIDQREMTTTQKMNRNRIQENFKYFIDLAYQDF
jgi:long-chain acyl-CoA synthetase